uniref:Uncharacterized protein n=1 Tax=Romanomermis culicivorax TaxID=13658 RepID=A0A915KGD7_ROMCU
MTIGFYRINYGQQSVQTQCVRRASKHKNPSRKVKAKIEDDFPVKLALEEMFDAKFSRFAFKFLHNSFLIKDLNISSEFCFSFGFEIDIKNLKSSLTDGKP